MPEYQDIRYPAKFRLLLDGIIIAEYCMTKRRETLNQNLLRQWFLAMRDRRYQMEVFLVSGFNWEYVHYVQCIFRHDAKDPELSWEETQYFFPSGNTNVLIEDVMAFSVEKHLDGGVPDGYKSAIDTDSYGVLTIELRVAFYDDPNQPKHIVTCEYLSALNHWTLQKHSIFQAPVPVRKYPWGDQSPSEQMLSFTRTQGDWYGICDGKDLSMRDRASSYEVLSPDATDQQDAVELVSAWMFKSIYRIPVWLREFVYTTIRHACRYFHFLHNKWRLKHRLGLAYISGVDKTTRDTAIFWLEEYRRRAWVDTVRGNGVARNIFRRQLDVDEVSTMVEEVSYDVAGDPELAGPFQNSTHLAKRLGAILAYDAWIEVLSSTQYTEAGKFIEP